MSSSSKNNESENAGRSARKRERTRAELIAAARKVFAERGFHEASIAEITEQADIGVGTFYLHFRDKDDAFITLLDEGFGEMQEEIRSQIVGGERVLNLTTFVELALQQAYTRLDLFQIALTARGQFARTRVFKAQSNMVGYITLVLAGFEESDALRGYDIPVLARLIAGTIAQAIFWWFENPEPAPAVMARQVLHLLQRGLPASLFDDEEITH